MKNLKKVLALVLVVATLLTMTTIASAKFTDADKVEYTEAVDVLTAINVLNGYTDGSFRPDGNVTRAQMAKMVAYIVAGGEDVGSLYAGANSFSDCTTHWAKGYIAYANKTGIVAGVGGGKFNPDGSVTGTQAAKMMLCALGYDAAIEEYTGTNWAVNVLSDARDAGLLKGLTGVDMSKAMTREQAAQLMLNALKADVVKYTNKGSNIDLGNGIIINTGASDAEAVTSDNTVDYNKSADGKLQLCEKYFEDLKLEAATADAFGRPSVKWTYDKAEVGTYAKEADATYTDEVKSGTLYTDLGLSSSTVASVIEDGVDTANFTVKKGDDTKIGGKGVLIEAYVDDNKDVTLVEINTYVGQVSNVATAEDVKADEEPYIEITGLTGNGGKFETSVKYAEDDIVLYTYDKSEKEIKSVALAEKVEDLELTSTTGNTKFVAGGKTYEYNKNNARETVNLKDSITVYLDANGYVVYVEKYEAGSTNYAFVLDTKKNNDGWTSSKNTYEAKLLLTDGTVITVNTDDVKATVNTFVSYTVDDDDVYTLTAKDKTAAEADKKDAIALNKGKAKFTAGGTTYYANSSTIFLVHDNTNDEYAVYTGIANVPSMTGEAAVYVNSKTGAAGSVASIVYISAADTVVSDANKALVYVIAGSKSDLVKDADKGDYYTYDAVIDGEITTIDVAKSYVEPTTGSAPDLASGDVLASKLTYNSKNVVTGITTYANTSDEKVIPGIGTLKTTDGTVGLDGEYYTYADDVAVFKIENNDFSKVGVTTIRDDSNDTFKALVKNGEVVALFITVKAGNPDVAEKGEAIVTNQDELDKALTDADTKTITLYDGTYTLSNTIDKDVAIEGNGDVTIKTHSVGSWGENAGVHVSGSANVTVSGVTFKADGANARGIITAPGFTGSISVESCTFDGVVTGIYLNACKGGTIKNCEFLNCTAGIGIDFLTGKLNVVNCTFSRNGDDIGVTKGHSSAADVVLSGTTATIKEY